MEHPSLQSPPIGAFRFNTDSAKMEYYDGNQWVTISSTSPEAQTGGTRGLFGGGDTTPALSDTIDYINIASAGNAVDFANLTRATRGIAGFSSRSRGVFAGGYDPGYKNIMEYITIQTEGNAVDFGDLITTAYRPSTFSSETRGIITSMETNPNNNNNIIEYVTIASKGDAKDFGDQTVVTRNGAGCSSPTRGIHYGGYSQALAPAAGTNAIQYVTMATTGNAADFGDASAGGTGTSAVSNSIRGLVHPANTPTLNGNLEYITIATLGNTIDFGDLTVARQNTGSASSPVRAVVAGGQTPTKQDVIDYVQISTTGDATDFGNLFAARMQLAGFSNGHGGLG